MTGVTFFETLRRHWRQALWWGIGLGLLAWVQIVAVPNVEAIQDIARVLESMPPMLLQMFGASDIEYMATPEGYIASQVFSLFLLLLSAYAIVVGLNITANDEDRGTLDVVLSHPIPRWRLVLEKWLAYALLSTVVVLLNFGLAWLALVMTPTLGVDVGKVFVGMISALPGMLLFLAFTALVTALIRRRSLAMGVVIAAVVAGYFIDTIGKGTVGSILETLRVLSPFRYYNGTEVMRLGVDVNGLAVLGIATLVLLVLSLFAFERRDVGA